MARERWLARPLEKESSRVTSDERTKAFAAKYGDMLLALISDEIAAEYGQTCAASHIAGLRGFFNWCVRAKLIPESPFRPDNVATRSSRGNARKSPPPERIVMAMIAKGWEALPSYGGWLAFGAGTAARPGESDTIRWSDFNRELSYVRIERQWNEKADAITAPKNGITREVFVPEWVRDHLQRVPNYDRRLTDEYAFANTRGEHLKPTSRAFYWKAVKVAVPELGANKKWTTYMCTRHYCGWYLVSVLEQSSEEVPTSSATRTAASWSASSTATASAHGRCARSK